MFSHEIEEGDEEEVEAFIKKRVKEGSGKDYESIINKNVSLFKGNSALKEEDHNEFSKFESSL